MARPPEVSDEQIIEAGLELEAEFPGREIGPTMIRTRLTRGNSPRIGRIWEAFLARRKEEEAKSREEMAALPPEIITFLQAKKDELGKLLDQFCGRTFASAGRVFESRFGAETTRLKGELDAKLDTLTQAYERHDELSDDLRRVSEAAETETKRLDAMRQQAAESKGRAEKAEETLELERERWKAAEERLRQEISQLTERAVRAEMASSAPGNARSKGGGHASMSSGA